MVAVATFGPPVRIDGPLPVAPTFSLLNTARVLNDATRAAVEQAARDILGPAPIQAEVESAEEFAARSAAWLDDLYDYVALLLPEEEDGGDIYRWGNGAQVYPYPPDGGHSFDPCSTGSFRQKDEGEPPPLPTFAAFTAYLPETCTSSRIVSQEYFTARAQLAFGAVESAIYENVLAEGGALNGTGQPYLADPNMVALNGGAAVSPKEGLALLEDAISGTHRRGMIHATPATGIAWSFFGEAIQERGPILESMGGNPVVIGDGYLGVLPDSYNGALSSTQAWAFASGPVQVRREPQIRIYPSFLKQALDRANNIVTYRAERDALVSWDSVLQVGVLIDRSLA